MNWNYRRIKHLYDKHPRHEPWYTVHEFYYEGRTARFFNPKPASPLSKEDLERMKIAFDKPALVWVDDATVTYGENGEVDYKSWGWMRKRKKK